MTDADLEALEDWVRPLLDKLEPSERRRLARTLAQGLRTRQRQRIAAQRNPDGSPFEPRKPQARAQSGFVRRGVMFAKIRQAKHLKARATPGEAAVGFLGRVARIARVHQEGLRARVEPGGPYHRYPARELLGLSAADRAWVREQLIDHLA